MRYGRFAAIVAARCFMKFIRDIASSLAAKANALVAQEESSHPGLREVAAMVYVGDVYALREQGEPAKSDGWKRRHYSGDLPGRP
jgi:hypothetical protein